MSVALTNAQLLLLKADIEANPDLNSQPNTIDGSVAIAEAYNVLAVPDYFVWTEALDKHAIYGQGGLDVDGVTVTAWSWPEYAALATGDQNAWTEMFNETGVQDARLANVRAAWPDIFKGGQAATVAQRAHINAIAKRLALRGEVVFVTSGLGTRVSPGVMDVVGTLSANDVHTARNLV